MGDRRESQVRRESQIPKLIEASVPQLENKLWKAVTQGKVKPLQQFLEECKEHEKFEKILNSVDDEYDEDGGHVVIHCVKEGRDKGSLFGGRDHGACMALLVASGADINKSDKFKRTALTWAVNLKYPNYVNRLLQLGADTTILDQDGYGPFHIAVYRGYKDIVISFIDFKPEIVDFKDGQGVPPLVTAAKYKRVDMCRLLLEKGADVNAAEDKNKRTSVYHAIRNSHLELLEILLK